MTSTEIRATAADGRVLLNERVGPGRAGRASFDAPPGLIGLELALESSTGTRLDADYRGLSVPDLRVTRPTLATPQFFRTRTALAFSETSHDADALPTSTRHFSRAERLLIRVPAYAAGEGVPAVGARLLNRRGTPMRELDTVPSPELPRNIAQFDLSLASLPPGEYRLELTASNAEGPREQVQQTLVIRVTH